MRKTIVIQGVNIDLVTNKTVLSIINQLLKSKRAMQIVTPNPEHIIEAKRNYQFKQVLNAADLAVPDGYGLVWAIKNKIKKNRKLKKDLDSQIERVTGVDLMIKICELAAKQKWRVGLLGGGRGVAQKTAKALCCQFDGLVVKTLPCPQAIAVTKVNIALQQLINKENINVLFVALGAPKQELFIAKQLPSCKTVIIAMGVGGAFDLISGKLKRAPLWIQDLHLEWLFRLFQEPWRWKRQIRLIEFVWRELVGN